MEFNFSVPLMSYETNEEVEDSKGIVKLSNLLATQLVSTNKGSAMKYVYWAIELYAGKPLILDKVDTKTLKEFIENDTSLINLVKYQLLTILEKPAKEKDKGK